MKKLLGILAAVLVLAVVLVSAAGVYLWRRALPQLDGAQSVPGVTQPVQVLRDPWGIPHIFAATDSDAYFALGWVMAQDRLFQMDLIRHVANGRLAEWFGADVLGVDKLFRTIDLPGAAKRQYEQATPRSREAMRAYVEGVNAYGRELGSALPPEYLLLRVPFEDFRPEQVAAVAGFMTWGLNPAWRMDVLHEKIRSKLGPRRTALLYPYTAGASPSVYPRGAHLAAGLPRLTPEQESLLAGLSGLSGSNSWAVGPSKSASGSPILASDPHLELRHPSIWYQAHLQTPELDVAGVFAPGLPFVVIGRNRHIAWGLTNLMADQGDFFIEKLRPGEPGEVMVKGRWEPLRVREEVIRMKGGEAVTLQVRETPHGPLVTELLDGQKDALAYQWIHTAADLWGEGEAPNEIDGFFALNRARDWASFRTAVGHFGAVAQNITYADREGHIGMQATGRLPRYRPGDTGARFREGWSGQDDWLGAVPFQSMPRVFDPPEGFVASANNPTLPRPMPFYISAYWEPMDRIRRIRERLQDKQRFSLEEMAAMQSDILWITARETVPLIVEAFATAPFTEAKVHAALELLKAWDGEMRADSPAAAVFAVFYKQVFHRIFDDELGPALTDALRARANVSSIMIRAALFGDAGEFLDRSDTPRPEERTVILRGAMEDAVEELAFRLGDDPAQWQWGRMHAFTLQHPLGRVKLLAPLFNDGPHPMGGHALTVAKAQYKDEDFQVYHGPSTRQVTDMAHPERALGVIPGGQSGIPASPHYADLVRLWLAGEHHPVLMSRDDVEQVAAHRLVLQPR